MDSIRFSFPACFSVIEAVEKNDFLASPESGALLYLFTTEICEISFTTVTVSKHDFHGRLPCDHQTEPMTFAKSLTLCQHLYEISRAQRKQITLFECLGSHLRKREFHW